MLRADFVTVEPSAKQMKLVDWKASKCVLIDDPHSELKFAAEY